MKLGWNYKQLGDVCENLDSKRVPITKSKRLSGPIPYYGASGVVDHVTDYLFDEDLLLVSEDGANLLARTYSIAFSISGKVWVNNHAHVLRFGDIDSQRFIEYYLNSISLEPYVSGMAQPKLNQKSLNSITVPSPPLPEQKRIVAILDKAFAGIDAAVANTENNLANARELFESYLNGVFTQKSDGWVERTLEDLGVTQTGSTPKTSNRDNYGNFIPFIKPADFEQDGSLDYENQGLSEEGLGSARKVVEGSALMVCIGATIGKCGWTDRDVTTNQQINTLSPVDSVSHKFIYYQMRTANFQGRVLSNAGQATLPIINKSKWNILTAWLPKSISDQNAIVEKLDTLQAETQHLETIYQQKLKALAELKQSILQKAFAGELTTLPEKTVEEALE